MDRFHFGKIDKKKLVVAGVVAAVILTCVLIHIFTGSRQDSRGSDSDSGLTAQNIRSTDENGSMAGEVLNNETTAVPAEESDYGNQGEYTQEDSGQDYEFLHNGNGGASVNVDEYAGTDNLQQAIGIDVSRYQGKIEWSEVAASGIEFAIIRVGYRTTISGEICEDPYAAYNLTNAIANHINIGVYFFSCATSDEEARKEAEWTINYIAKYPITYPVVYNCEGFNDSDSRQYGIGIKERSSFAKTFLDTVKGAGYTPMFYASVTELNASASWDTQMLSDAAKIWVAWYPDLPYPETKGAVYQGTHQMWQYTSNGEVRGISKPVDIDVSYLGIESMSDNDSDNGETSEPDSVQVTISPEADMVFRSVDENVQAKQEVNLRNRPSQDTDAEVIVSVKNGEVIKRTGISDSGWSRVIYNGQTCYAVSSYLTTDLSYVYSDNDNSGIRTKFRAVDETVTPKEEVNLRNIPSVTEDTSVVVATVYNGEQIRRTGISDEMGWSRVEYNGQTLYCISSYLE